MARSKAKSKAAAGAPKNPVAPPSTPPATGTRRVLRITSSAEGFWRAGVQHSKTPVDHAPDDFDAAQLAQLEAEPKLTLEYVDVPEAGNETKD